MYSPRATHHCQADPGAASRPLGDEASWGHELTTAQRLLHNAQGHSVFDAAARVEELSLSEDLQVQQEMGSCIMP
jgi:hypothetical protein